MRVGGMDDVGFDHQVLVDEFGRIAVVGVDAANFGRGEVDLLGLLFGEEGVDCLLLGEVEFHVRAGKELRHSGWVIAAGTASAITGKLPDDGRADHAAMARDLDFCGLSHAS